jgi:flagellar motor switch protein FliN
MMSDDMLSQDEIDALLRGSALDEDLTSRETDVPPVDDYFSEIEKDALGKLETSRLGVRQQLFLPY